MLAAAHHTVRERRLLGLFFALCALPFFCVFPYIASVNNPNENVRVYMTLALVEQHTVRIDDIVARHGWVNDMARVPDPQGRGDGWYRVSVKGPAVGYAGVPAYWLFHRVAPQLGLELPSAASPPAVKRAWLTAATWFLRLTTVQAPCFLFLIAFERHLRSVSRDLVLRLATVAAVGLGTNYLAYALMYSSHALVAVAAYAAFACAEVELRCRAPHARRPGMAFVAGLGVAWATALEYQSLPLSLCLGVFGLWVFRRPRSLLAFLAGGAVWTLAVMAYQQAAYGNPFTPGHKYVESTFFAAGHAKGLFGIGSPDVTAMRSLLTSREYGLFGMSPFLASSVLGLAILVLAPRGSQRARRSARASGLAAGAASLSLLLGISGYYLWRGGWTVGPRLLGGLPPLLGFAALVGLERVARFGLRGPVRGLAVVLALVGILSVGVVSLVYNTLPEGISRPLSQFAWPMLRTGHVPHHVLEWLGVRAAWPFYAVLLALLVAPLIALAASRRASWGQALARLVAVLVATCGLVALLQHEPRAGVGAEDLSNLSAHWEPAGRDFVARQRDRAARHGHEQPCEWAKLARMESLLGRRGEAAKHRATAKGAECTMPFWLR